MHFIAPICRLKKEIKEQKNHIPIHHHHLHPPRPPHLQNLPRQPIVRPQHRPARAIRLDERQLELRAQDAERAARGVDGAVERERGRVALAVGGGEVEVDVRGGKGNGRGFLDDFFEVEGRYDRRAGLVEVVSGNWGVSV